MTVIIEASTGSRTIVSGTMISRTMISRTMISRWLNIYGNTVSATMSDGSVHKVECACTVGGRFVLYDDHYVHGQTSDIEEALEWLGCDMIITTTCPICGVTAAISVNQEGYNNWKRGMLIQEALPELSPVQRELLVSGICPMCWDKMCNG